MLNILKRIGLCLCPFLLTVLLCVLKERYIKITLLVIIVFIITYIGSKVLEFIKSKLTFKQSNKISVIIGGTVCQIYWFICFIILYANSTSSPPFFPRDVYFYVYCRILLLYIRLLWFNKIRRM